MLIFYLTHSIIPSILERCWIMSHFTVLVIGNDVDGQLAPYAEQGFDEQYGVFDNKEAECRAEYETDTIDVVDIDGQLYSQYDEQFRDRTNFMSNERKYPEGSVLKTVPMKEFYGDFESFLSDYHGFSEPDEKTGQYGYWSNPNAKWDWYTIGGRWTGYFKPKTGTAGALGKPGAFDNQPRQGWVDQIKYGDVDFVGMKADAAKKANETFDVVETIVQGRDIPSWTEIRERHGDKIDNARDEYHNNPVVKAFKDANFDSFFIDLHDEYGHGREAYVNKCVSRVAVSYSILIDGKWYQKGEMGWFGMSSGDVTQEQWNDEFWKLLDGLDSDTLLTLVDCHI